MFTGFKISILKGIVCPLALAGGQAIHFFAHQCTFLSNSALFSMVLLALHAHGAVKLPSLYLREAHGTVKLLSLYLRDAHGAVKLLSLYIREAHGAVKLPSLYLREAHGAVNTVCIIILARHSMHPP